jgi:hypothetical protein
MNVLLSVILFLIFCFPGIPLGIWLCGRNVKNQPEGFFYGLLAGHIISTILIVGLVYLFPFSWLTGVLYTIIIISSILITIWRLGLFRIQMSYQAPLSLRPWGKGDYLVLLTSLIIFLALATPPQLNMGRETPSGYAFYGSFAADSLRNLAFIAELSKGEIPPQNPYVSGNTLHYYWLSYIAPATIYKILGKKDSLQDLLTGYTLFAGFLFLTIFFSTLRLYTHHIFPLGVGMFILLLATNYKGFYLWWTFPGNTQSFIDQMLHFKIEASTLRIWRVAIMGLYRYLLVAPQHLFALAFFLMGWTLCTNDERRMQNDELMHRSPRLSLGQALFITPRSFILTSFLIGILFGYSGFIGLIAITWYGGCLAVACFSSKKALKENLSMFFMAIGILIIPLVIFYSLKMIVPGRGDLLFSLNKTFLKDAFQIFFVNLGPGFVLGTLGMLVALWTLIRSRSSSFLLPNFWLMGICLFLFTMVVVQNFWEVTLKSSLVMVLNLIFFSVWFLDFVWKWLQKLEARSQGSGVRSGISSIWFLALRLSSGQASGPSTQLRTGLWLLLMLLCLPAIPTAILDAYIYTKSTSPVDTDFIGLEDMKAFTWIRDNLPERSIIQGVPQGFDEEDVQVNYAGIPSFAQRRTALGDKLDAENFQIPEGQVAYRQKQITAFFKSHDLARAMDIARQYGIQYVYVGPTERNYYLFGLSKFDNFKNLFREVYHQDGVRIFQILDGEPVLVTLRASPVEETSYQAGGAIRIVVNVQNQNANYPVHVELDFIYCPLPVAYCDEQETMDLSLRTDTGQRTQLGPGEEKEVTLTLQAPENPGVYQVEVVGKILLEGEDIIERASLQVEDLPHHTGQNVQDLDASTGISRVGKYGRDAGGFLTYGPFVELPAGKYHASFRLKGRDLRPEERIATLDVLVDRKEVAREKLFSENFSKPDSFEEFKIPFVLDTPGNVEFRTYFHANHGMLYVDNITLFALRDPNEQNLVIVRKLDQPIQVK